MNNITRNQLSKLSNVQINIWNNIIGDKIWENTDYKIWDSIKSNLGTYIWLKIWDSIENEIRHNIPNNIWHHTFEYLNVSLFTLSTIQLQIENQIYE